MGMRWGGAHKDPLPEHTASPCQLAEANLCQGKGDLLPGTQRGEESRGCVPSPTSVVRDALGSAHPAGPCTAPLGTTVALRLGPRALLPPLF